MARSQSPGGDLQDFWKEFEDIETSKKENYNGEEEEISKTPDEGELEAQWLENTGYGFLVSRYQAGKELTEDEIQALTDSLPRNHAAVVKKRVDTLNATLRRKQKYTTKIDVRNIFPQQRNAETVVIHSQVVDDADDKPKQALRPSTLPRGMKLSHSLNGGDKSWIRQKKWTVESKPPHLFAPIVGGICHQNSDLYPTLNPITAISSSTWTSSKYIDQIENSLTIQPSVGDNVCLGPEPVYNRPNCPAFNPVTLSDSHSFSHAFINVSSWSSSVHAKYSSEFCPNPASENSDLIPVYEKDIFDLSPTQTSGAQSTTVCSNESSLSYSNLEYDNENAFEQSFAGLKISRSDSQGSDSLLTSPSRSKSSSCDTLDSIDSGLDSSSSNLNKEQSSSKDSLDYPIRPKDPLPHPDGKQNNMHSAKRVAACFSRKLLGSRFDPNARHKSQGSKAKLESPPDQIARPKSQGPKAIPESSISPRPSSDKPRVLPSRSRKRKHRQRKAPKSPVSPRNEVIHPEFGSRQNKGASKGAGPFAKNKGGYSMSGMTEEVHGNAEYGVEMLSLQQPRETYNKRNSQLSPISDADISFEISVEENGKDGNSHGSFPGLYGDNTLPNFSLVADKLGLTRIQDISEADLGYVRKQSLLELTHMFDNQNIMYSRRRAKKRYKENGLFGVPLQVLIEHDQRLVPNSNTKVPLVFTEVLKYLTKNCLDTEGILRIPGSSSRVKQLRAELEEKFYQGTFIWSEDLTPNDVAALMKQFLRELPVPLLTDEYIDAFAQVENLPDRKQQLHALNLLILLLPNVHRDTLHDLLVFLELIIEQSSVNRMSLPNVSMIMAPNLFMAPKVQNSDAPKDNKRAFEVEIKMAAGTSNIMKMLIKYRQILWTIPSYLISLVRRQYELEQIRKSKDKTRMKFLAKKDKTEVYKKPNIKHETDFQEGVVRVQAPHLTKSSTAIQLDQNMTAGDIVSKFRVIQGSQTLDPRKLTQSQKSSQAQVFADPRKFLSAGEDTFLFEKGGNIGERCLPNDTNMMAMYKVNPNAEWIIKCRDGS